MDININYIIQNSINGDKKFQEILLKKLHPLIYKNIYKYFSIDDNIIEDLVQDGYLMILQSLKSFDEKRNIHFLGYVKMNLDFYYKNYYRDTKHQRETLSLNYKLDDSSESIEFEDIIEDDNISMEDKVIRKIEICTLENNVKKLSTKEQDVLNLYYKDNLSMDEISKCLNIAYRTAISRKYTAMCRLKKIMVEKKQK